MEYIIKAVGHVRGGRSDPVDDDWGQIRSTIELDLKQFGPDALAGLDAFSHAEIIFLCVYPLHARCNETRRLAA